MSMAWCRRVALHGATLFALEGIAPGLVAVDDERAPAWLDRLEDLRAAIAGGAMTWADAAPGRRDRRPCP
jgi:hypothetical protein